MANDRGNYGKNGVPHIGQDPSRFTTVYVERESSSVGKWILGGLAVGGALLWGRHQGKQIEQLYKTAGLPHQSFTSSLRERAKSLRPTFRMTSANRPLASTTKGEI